MKMPAEAPVIPPEARDLSTAEISDALDALRLPGSALGLGHVAGRKKIFGPAFTVQYVPVDTASPGTVGDYLDDTPQGAVVVLDNAGRADCTVWAAFSVAWLPIPALAGLSSTVCAVTRP